MKLKSTTVKRIRDVSSIYDQIDFMYAMSSALNPQLMDL